MTRFTMLMFVVMVMLLSVITAHAVETHDGQKPNSAALMAMLKANGMWRSTAGELWRFQLDDNGLTFFVDGLDIQAQPDNSGAYFNTFDINSPARFTITMPALQTVGSVEVWGRYMTIITDDGNKYMAEYVRPLNERDWQFIDSIRHPADRGCGLYNQRC